MSEARKSIAIVAAVSANGVIGRGNDLPWKLPDDMKFFMQLTRGHTVIMGRRTFESMNSKPLGGRRNIVITRQAGWGCVGVEAAGSLEQAITLASMNQQGSIFIVGGGEIYAQALEREDVTRMYLTRIDAHITGDTLFPNVDWGRWLLLEQRDHAADERHAFAFSFQIYGKAPRNPAR